jgi:predicted nucleotidyltransferase
MLSNEVLQEVTVRLVNGFHPQKIILFGSQARGTADNRSDVDILILCTFQGKRRHLMVEMNRALGDLDYAVDILVLTPEEFQRDRFIQGTIGRYAYKEGKVVYGIPERDNPA